MLLDLYGPVQPGVGFGMDAAVVDEPAAAGVPQGPGPYYRGGAFGTWFWIDPVNELIVVGMNPEPARQRARRGDARHPNAVGAAGLRSALRRGRRAAPTAAESGAGQGWAVRAYSAQRHSGGVAPLALTCA